MSRKYAEMSKEELKALQSELSKEYEQIKDQNLSLNIARGKPSEKQLDLSEELLRVVSKNEDCFAEDGMDCRTYGDPYGIPEARRFMAELMDAPASQVLVFGNASLAIMFDMVSRSFTHGVCGHTPWCKLDKVKFICPSPGYDRHFAITEYFGCELISVPMLATGPDMDAVEELVRDEAVKGIWCVPKYTNPLGISFSDDTVRRLASLKPAAPDFRIFWDTAYSHHHLDTREGVRDEILNIWDEAKKAGNPDIFYQFMSTSKMSYAGGGISALAASDANLADVKLHLKYQTIGFDKVNQMRHVKFFKNMDGVRAHLEKHAEIVRPKFLLIDKKLREDIADAGIGTWTLPNGGYFISFDALPGCAKEIVKLSKEAGLTLTDAGASFPYHKDPEDKNIRLAPSTPELGELEKAMNIFTLCVKLASVSKLLDKE